MLFLDVDGPLLPLGGDPDSGTRDTAPDSYLGRLTPELGQRLTALSCDLAWATTWEDDANLDIAPRIGLPHLPVVHWPEPSVAEELEDRWFGLCWKTRILVRWAAGRPFAWFDDEITERDQNWVASHHGGHALLHHVPPHRGLTGDDLATVDHWLRGS